MAKYIVIAYREVSYETTVEADSDEEAEKRLKALLPKTKDQDWMATGEGVGFYVEAIPGEED